MALAIEQKKFIEIVGKLAAADMFKSGILASLTIAQAVLESDWGKSILATKGFALFGIKATSTWKGKVFNKETQEYFDGVNAETVKANFRAYDTWEESIKDHSALITGLKRYAAVIGETDYKTACRAIKAAGYATDPAYPEKLIKIIEQYGLTKYDVAQAEKGGNKKMNLIQRYITKNDCYKSNVKKAGAAYTKFQSKGPAGLMLHSVGCAQPSAMAFINQWDKAEIEKAVHGFIEPNGNIYQCLPYNFRGWHSGVGSKGSANDTHLGFEMTEPETIEYISGAIFKDKDPIKTREHVAGTYKTAVELFATLCEEFKFDPLKSGVIISHSEGCKRGIASNHADVEHIWNKYGYTMDQFRKDVKNAMSGAKQTTQTKPAAPAVFVPYTIKVKANPLNIRKGPGTNYATNGAIKDKGIYTITEEKEGSGAKLWGKLKSGAGWISLDYAEKI